jgi:hypothetical protein
MRGEARPRKLSSLALVPKVSSVPPNQSSGATELCLVEQRLQPTARPRGHETGTGSGAAVSSRDTAFRLS